MSEALAKNSKKILVTDIGGTFARFALVDNQGIHDIQQLNCSDYENLSEITQAYLKNISLIDSIRSAIFAIAGPIEQESIHFTSLPHWSTPIKELKSSLKLNYLEVMNDFKAVALSIPIIDSSLLIQVNKAQPKPYQVKGVIGPGTGLGVASLFWTGTEFHAQSCEGGHVTLPVTNELEFELFKLIQQKFGHVSAERVISGQGLKNIFNALCILHDNQEFSNIDPVEISSRAISGQCSLSRSALDLMLIFLGRVAGNLALTLHAQGGIYIAGGIAPKISDYILQSQLLAEFEAKGRMKSIMQTIPLYLINHDTIALKGLEYYAQLHLRK
ncbi:MAG: glucokinase [Pseudomonadota bacterium]